MSGLHRTLITISILGVFVVSALLAAAGVATAANTAAASKTNLAARRRTAMPSPPLTADETALVTIANAYARTCRGRALGCTDHLAVVGRFALVGYSDNKHSGEAFLAVKHSTTWHVVINGGGWFSAADILNYEPSMGTATALQLERAASPRWSRCRCS